MNYPVKIDLHIHTVVSDGTDTPEKLLDRVKEKEIELFAVTDHDSIKGCQAMRRAMRPGDPQFITGAEMSCRDEEGKYHILGYGFDPDSESIRTLVDKGHQIRLKKVRARLDFLRDRFGFYFPKDELRRLMALDNPGKPHIGNLMVRLGYASSKEEAISKYINQLRFKNEYIRPEEAISLILGGGGIPVLAHPFYGSGDQLILGDEMEERLRRLIGFGLQGVEAFYSGFTTKLSADMLAFAEKYDLLVTAGSDYHGENKLVPLGDTGCEDASKGPSGMLRFFDEISRRMQF